MTDFRVIAPGIARTVEALAGRSTAVSHPMPDILNGIPAERFFLYPTGSSLVRERPFAVLTTAMDGGMVLEYINCHAGDFFDSEKHPMDTKISYALPRDIPTREYRLQESTMEKLYELTRRAAFKPQLTDMERRTVGAWFAMLEGSVPRDLFPFYIEMGKNFYEWVIKNV